MLKMPRHAGSAMSSPVSTSISTSQRYWCIYCVVQYKYKYQVSPYPKDKSCVWATNVPSLLKRPALYNYYVRPPLGELTNIRGLRSKSDTIQLECQLPRDPESRKIPPAPSRVELAKNRVREKNNKHAAQERLASGLDICKTSVLLSHATFKWYTTAIRQLRGRHLNHWLHIYVHAYPQTRRVSQLLLPYLSCRGTPDTISTLPSAILNESITSSCGNFSQQTLPPLPCQSIATFQYYI